MVLAVSALCAIQELSSLNHNLGLFILEEPTESLDPVLSNSMAQHMGLHVSSPQTIITTNQPSFAKSVESSAGVARVEVINLNNWTQDTGTTLEKGN